MRSTSLDRLCTGLNQLVSGAASTLAFRSAQARHRPLRRFSSAPDCIAYLTSCHGDLDEKDLVLATLVAMAQRCEGGQLPSLMLWLAMRPALGAICRQNIRRCGGDRDELVSAVIAAFAEEVAQLHLHAVTRVAATLARSTRRRVLDELRRGPQAPVRPDEAFVPFGELHSELDSLRARLQQSVGPDADLLIATTVMGWSRQEMADHLGLRLETVRKRLHRVRLHARRRLADAGSEPVASKPLLTSPHVCAKQEQSEGAPQRKRPAALTATRAVAPWER